MKKLLFGLVATVMFGFVGSAQTKITKEEARLQFAKAMSSLVDQVKPNYNKKLSADENIQILVGNSTIPTEGQEVLRKAFTYLEKGTSSESIIKSDSGKEMAAVAYVLSKSKDLKEGAVKVFGDNSFGHDGVFAGKTCWFCSVWDWIWSNHDEIIQIICMFISVC